MPGVSSLFVRLETFSDTSVTLCVDVVVWSELFSCVFFLTISLCLEVTTVVTSKLVAWKCREQLPLHTIFDRLISLPPCFCVVVLRGKYKNPVFRPPASLPLFVS